MGAEMPPEDATLTRADVLAIARRRPHAARIDRVLARRRPRERAPRARDHLDRAVGVLNTTRARMPRQGRRATRCTSSSAGCASVRRSPSASSSRRRSRDEAWQFFTLGRSIERADMTARLLATRSLTEASGPSWTTSCAAAARTRPTCARYRGVPSARNAAEFLLLDRLFPREYPLLRDPRGAVHARHRAAHRPGRRQRPGAAAARPDPQRAGVPSDRRNPRGPRRATWTTCSSRPARPSEAIRQRYFPTNAAPSWVAGEFVNRLRIKHMTGFHYTGEVTASYNEARMLPASTRRASSCCTRTSTSCRSRSQHSYVDYWGTRVSSFEILTPHKELALTATSLVEVRPREHPQHRLTLGGARRRGRGSDRVRGAAQADPAHRAARGGRDAGADLARASRQPVRRRARDLHR